jgi:hypothetical protein
MNARGVAALSSAKLDSYFNQKFFMLITVFIYLAVEENGIHNELYARFNQIIHSK